jgi:hypothetical protein
MHAHDPLAFIQSISTGGAKAWQQEVYEILDE